MTSELSVFTALLVSVMMALSSVLAPFVSQNCGAGNPARARAALLLCMRFALLFQLAIYGLVWLLAPLIANLFSDHPQVVRLIVLYLHLVPIGYGFQGMVMLLASALNGVRASTVSFVFNGMRLFVFLLPGAWLGAKLRGEQGIYLGILLANLAAGLLAWGYAHRRFEGLCHQVHP